MVERPPHFGLPRNASHFRRFPLNHSSINAVETNITAKRPCVLLVVPMKKFILLLSSIAISSAAYCAPASEESINLLLEVTKSDQLAKNMLGNVDQVMRNVQVETTKGKTLSAKQQEEMKALTDKMIEIVRKEISWTQLRPLSVQIYQESFTQEEIDGLIAFYKSPAGMAVIEKMPIVMQKTMNAMMMRMGPLMEQFNQELHQVKTEKKKAK